MQTPKIGEHLTLTALNVTLLYKHWRVHYNSVGQFDMRKNVAVLPSYKLEKVKNYLGTEKADISGLPHMSMKFSICYRFTHGITTFGGYTNTRVHRQLRVVVLFPFQHGTCYSWQLLAVLSKSQPNIVGFSSSLLGCFSPNWWPTVSLWNYFFSQGVRKGWPVMLGGRLGCSLIQSSIWILKNTHPWNNYTLPVKWDYVLFLSVSNCTCLNVLEDMHWLWSPYTFLVSPKFADIQIRAFIKSKIWVSPLNWELTDLLRPRSPESPPSLLCFLDRTWQFLRIQEAQLSFRCLSLLRSIHAHFLALFSESFGASCNLSSVLSCPYASPLHQVRPYHHLDSRGMSSSLSRV